MKFQKSKYQHFYNSKDWKKIREKHLTQNWKCNDCGIIKNLQVDHTINFDGDWTLFLEPKNLNTLCRKCHFFKTVKDTNIDNKLEGNYTISTKAEDDEINFQLDMCFFGADDVLKRYAKKIISESLMNDNVFINTYYLGILDLKKLIDFIIEMKKFKPKNYNGKTKIEFWKEIFKTWK